MDTHHYILYHGGCWDGLLAAYIIHYGFPFNHPGETVTAIPVYYGGLFPDMVIEPESKIFIVDFSYPRDTLEGIRSKCGKLVVLDHHKTARDELKDLPYARYEEGECGARMALEYTAEEYRGPRPGFAPLSLLIDYIEDRDLWLWKLKNSREINAWIRSFPMNFASIDYILSNIGRQSVSGGQSILRAVNQAVDAMIDRTLTMGHDDNSNIPVVNASIYNSEVGEELLKRYPEAPYSVSWTQRCDGKIEYQLRSRKDFDCSDVAKKHGGGGHAQAAGYVE